MDAKTRSCAGGTPNGDAKPDAVDDSTVATYVDAYRQHGTFDELPRSVDPDAGSHGGGARHLARAGTAVVEVDRPNRQVRRREDKSDPVDAEAAGSSGGNPSPLGHAARCAHCAAR